jgi:predicted TIM-barrel fold metal-dependent hydrolase
MRIWDCHCHCHGEEKGREVLKAMDEAGIERINLFSQYPYKVKAGRHLPHGPGSSATRKEVRERIDHIARVQSADPSRIYGMIWAEPRTPGIVEEIERGIVDKGLRGVKLIPDRWFPYDELMFPIYRKMEELGKPIMFHAGIVYGFEDSSRYCMPVGFECLLNFPKLRFSLAHIAWPWVDECLAVYGSFLSSVRDKPDRTQMFVDTCRGTPDAWRLEAFQKAVPFVGTEHLMFGVDTSPGRLAHRGPEDVGKDLAILRDVMGLSEKQIEEYFWGACERFLKA